MLEYMMTTDDSILDPARPLQFSDQVIAFSSVVIIPTSLNNS
jgi:hypothetical protein